MGDVTEAKKARSAKAGTVTRRINELNLLLQREVDEVDVLGKINNLKTAMEQLGLAQDLYLSLLEPADTATLEEGEKWYYGYSSRVDTVVQLGRRHVEKPKDVKSSHAEVKIKKL